jgi:hypothetical protein
MIPGEGKMHAMQELRRALCKSKNERRLTGVVGRSLLGFAYKHKRETIMVARICMYFKQIEFLWLSIHHERNEPHACHVLELLSTIREDGRDKLTFLYKTGSLY